MKRIFLLIALATVTFVRTSIDPVAVPPAQAQAGILTIGAFITGLQDTVKTLESSAHSLIDQGNNALAQQQMLLAGILQSLIQQLSTTYVGALDKTFDQIDVAQQNLARTISDSLNQLAGLEHATVGDVNGTIYKTQGAVNGILDRIPLIQKHPVFYGASASDLLGGTYSSAFDIELLGFHLTDGQLHDKQPDITVAGEQLPASAVAVQEDRVQIRLPAALRQTIRFGSVTCAPRAGFEIDMTVHASNHTHWWKLWDASEVDIHYRAFLLPAPDIFTAEVSFDGVRSSQAAQTHSYAQASGYVAMGCENTTGTNVVFNVPSGSTGVQCTASWVNTSNIKLSSQNCAVGGTTVTGVGTITGRDRNCFVVMHPVGWILGHKNVCNCPGGGHGQLQVSGSYTTTVTIDDVVSKADAGHFSFPGKTQANFALPSDTSLKKSRVLIRIHRKDCAETIDEVDIGVPDNKNLAASANSKSGLFKAVLQNDQLTLTNT